MAPDTIVLVHGFWVTPRSWENWIAHYEAKGYRVIAPGYPGFEVEVEALTPTRTPIVDVTVPAIIEQVRGGHRALDQPPIIMGHSAGGAFTQILLDHGFGAAGVALNSAPTEGVRVVPLSQVKSTFPVLKNPANRHKAVGLTFEQWNYAFTNTFPEEESAALYERYAIPASGGILWGSVLANFQPGHQETWVDYHNDDRAPLLFVSGSEDHIMPPGIQQSNAKHYKSDTVTEIRVRGLRAPAARAEGLGGDRRRRPRLGARARAMTRDLAILTHIGGPTAARSRSTGGGCSSTRPSTRPAGATVRLGHVVGKVGRAGGRPPPTSAPIDAVLLTHDHHADNLDDAGRAAAAAAAPCSPPSPAPTPAGGRTRRPRRPGDAPGSTAPGRPDLEITATPCRHGPPRAGPIVGHVIGFALRGGRAERRCSCGSPATPCSTRRARGRRGLDGGRRSSCTSATCSSRSPGRSATR